MAKRQSALGAAPFILAWLRQTGQRQESISLTALSDENPNRRMPGGRP